MVVSCGRGWPGFAVGPSLCSLFWSWDRAPCLHLLPAVAALSGRRLERGCCLCGVQEVMVWLRGRAGFGGPMVLVGRGGRVSLPNAGEVLDLQ